jgi:integrase
MASYRQLPSGHYRFQVRLKGVKPISKTFPTVAKGKRWATQVEAEIQEGKYQDTRSAEALTIHALMDWYLGQITPMKKDTALTRDRSKVLKLKASACLQGVTVATLTPDTVVNYVKERAGQGIKPASIKKELSALSHALEAAHTLREVPLPKGNPVRKAQQALRFTDIMHIDDERNRRMAPEEEGRLLQELNPEMRAIVTLLLETAMRRSELANARWEHVKGDVLLIPRTKTDKREIPLSPRALAVLATLPRQEDGRLIRYRPDSISHFFNQACKRAGIEDLRPHDLRHEATSRLFERGFSIPEVALMTGHADWDSLKRYTNLKPTDMAKKL